VNNLKWQGLSYEDFEYISELGCIGSMGVLVAYHLFVLVQFNIFVTICANVFIIALCSWYKRTRKYFKEVKKCQRQIKVEL